MADGTENRRPHPLLLILAAIGSLALIAAIFLMGLVVLAVFMISRNQSGDKGPFDDTEKVIAGVRLEDTVTPESADMVMDLLDEAKKSTQVVGILFEVNSPGGSVVASQELHDFIKQTRESVPVVAYVREMAASGAFYAASSASRIVVNRGSLVGSIGVILSSVDTTQLLQWAKIRPITVKTGKLKDAGSPTREWTAEDKAYLQTLINATRDQFAADVAGVRKLSPQTMEHMADGRVVLGTEAVKLKLADTVGSKEHALREIANLAGLKEVPPLHYLEKERTFSDVVRELLNEESSVQRLRDKVEDALLSGESSLRKDRRR